VSLDQKQVERLLAIVNEERLKEDEIPVGTVQRIEKALEICSRNLDNLTKLRYRELIGEDEFLRQRQALVQEQIKLRERLDQLKTEQWIAPSRKLILFRNRAVFWLAHGSAGEKRLILSTIGSHLSLKSKKLSIDAKEPFRVIKKKGDSFDWQRVVNDVRTFFRENPGYVIPELPEPRLDSLPSN